MPVQVGIPEELVQQVTAVFTQFLWAFGASKWTLKLTNKVGVLQAKNSNQDEGAQEEEALRGGGCAQRAGR